MIDIFKRWFSHSKEQDIDDSQNPWAGLASYEDPETAERKLKFCGRDDDSYDLARLIMGNVFVTLYGKSGIGKTSLLNAGVFPELREEQYTPVSIRLGMRDEEHPQSYQTMIVEAVERVVKRIETINVIDEQHNQQSIDYLWNYFARHRFYDKYDEPTTPVIVFDQFEEVLRGYRDEAETLLRQLDYLNDKDHSLDSCEVDGQPYRYEQNFRFVVSIREDDLYRLEDSIDNYYLPALKRCRYRLRSLSEEGARDAILIPGEGTFNPDEKDAITEAIISKSRNDDGSISTNIISLLCSRIYVDFKKSGADYISPTLVENFIKGNPFERFYNEATQGFSDREKSYIEDHLIDSTGRRNSIPESDFLLHIKNSSKLLEGKNRILQRVSTSSEGKNNRVELIHDSFCEPLAVLKRKREQRHRFLRLLFGMAVILVCITLISYFAYLVKQNESKDIEISSTTNSLFLSETKNDSLKQLNNAVSLLYDSIIKLNMSLCNQMDIISHQKDSLHKSLIALKVQIGKNRTQEEEINNKTAALNNLAENMINTTQMTNIDDNRLRVYILDFLETWRLGFNTKDMYFFETIISPNSTIIEKTGSGTIVMGKNNYIKELSTFFSSYEQIDIRYEDVSIMRGINNLHMYTLSFVEMINNNTAPNNLLENKRVDLTVDLSMYLDKKENPSILRIIRQPIIDDKTDHIFNLNDFDL